MTVAPGARPPEPGSIPTCPRQPPAWARRCRRRDRADDRRRGLRPGPALTTNPERRQRAHGDEHAHVVRSPRDDAPAPPGLRRAARGAIRAPVAPRSGAVPSPAGVAHRPPVGSDDAPVGPRHLAPAPSASSHIVPLAASAREVTAHRAGLVEGQRVARPLVRDRRRHARRVLGHHCAVGGDESPASVSCEQVEEVVLLLRLSPARPRCACRPTRVRSRRRVRRPVDGEVRARRSALAPAGSSVCDTSLPLPLTIVAVLAGDGRSVDRVQQEPLLVRRHRASRRDRTRRADRAAGTRTAGRPRRPSAVLPSVRSPSATGTPA